MRDLRQDIVELFLDAQRVVVDDIDRRGRLAYANYVRRYQLRNTNTRWYRKTAAGKTKIRAIRDTDEYRARHRAHNATYRSRPEVRERERLAAKARRARHAAT